MNLQTFKTLSWEIWGQNKLSTLLYALLLPLIAFVVHIIAARFPDMGINEAKVNNNLAISSLIFIAIAFSYTECSSKSIKTGFPKHLFLLPMPTWKLVLTPMLLGVLVVSVYGLVWINYILALEFSLVEQLAILVGLSSLLVWLQFINWVFSKNAIKATCSLLACVILVAIFGMSALGFLEYKLGQLIGLSGLVCWFVFGVVGAIYYVSACRQGDTAAGFEVLSEIISSIGPERGSRAFESRNAAQFWYEWKVFGWIFPVAAFLMAVPLYFVSEIDQLIVIFSSFYTVALALGIALATPYLGAKTFQILPATGILPLSNQELSRSKLMVAFYSLLLGCIFLFASLYASFLWGGYARHFLPYWENMIDDVGILNGVLWLVYQFICSVAGVWIVCSVPLVVCLCNKKRTHYIAIAVGVLLFLIGAVLALLADKYPLLKLFIGLSSMYVFGALSVAILVFIILIFEHGKKEGILVNLNPILFSATTVLILVSLLLLSFGVESKVAFFYVLFTFFLLVLSILPIVAAPLAVAMNRHRE